MILQGEIAIFRIPGDNFLARIPGECAMKYDGRLVRLIGLRVRKDNGILQLQLT